MNSVNKRLEIEEDAVQAHLCDTAGQDKYKEMVPTYFKKAVGCICVYDITEGKTFDGLEHWLRQLAESGEEDVLKVIGKSK